MTRRPDTIFLRGLEVECIIGFIEWERRIKQRLVIDLELPIDCARTAATDEVVDTLDYSQVAARVTAFIGSSSTMLVETLAGRAGNTAAPSGDAGASHRDADPRRIRAGVGAAVDQQAGCCPRRA